MPTCLVDLGNNGYGIYVNTSANNTIGGTTVGDRNIISGNDSSGIQIFNTTATGNIVAGNYIGVDVTGSVDLGNEVAGVVVNAPNNMIGGALAGASNLISGNNQYGVVILNRGGGGGGNKVQGNYIGTNAAGTAAIGNSGVGIAIFDSSNNIIGGAGAGNVSSGNVRGLYIAGTANNNQIKGNFIGTNATGTAALANNSGVFMEFGAANNQIGGTAAGEGNVISGNLSYAVSIGSCPSTSIQGNLIGTNAAGTAAIGNGGEGIDVVNSPNVLIGGTAAGSRNIISANGQSGIGIGGSATTSTQVQGNYIGTDITGTLDLGNAANGIFLSNANNSLIGGLVAGARNLISGNNGFGIAVQDNLATGNLIQGNYIGTNAAGTADLGNSGAGIVLANGAANNLIGGSSIAARNLVSGNDSNCIVIAGASNNTVQNNYIGTDVTGTLDLGNQGAGLAVVNGANNQFGGVGVGNLVSGNLVGMQILGAAATGNQVQGNYFGTTASGAAALLNDGTDVAIFDGASNNLLGGPANGAGNVLLNGITIGGGGAAGNQVQGNRIGTNAAGTAVLGNATHGIVISDAVSTIIGGTAAGARNLIAGSGQLGIWILGSNTSGTQVLGNYIGTDVTGTLDFGNALNGIKITNSPNNTIGGTAAGARNLISGNDSHGLVIEGPTATGNQVLGNYFGTNAAGSGALPNAGGGVLIVDSTNNSIGGTAAGASNRIAFNTGFGVAIAGTSTGNATLANSIFGNAGLGIDLIGDGVTANDAGDGDTGPNNLQNFPVLNPITTAGTVSGSLDSTVANAAYPIRIEFFANTACDASGNGEGEVFLGAASLGAPGSFTFNYAPVGGKTFITATATDANGNTSEFSACAQQPTNTPPTITAAAAITRQAGSPAASATIATVNDAETPAGNLTVMALTVPAGITVSGINNAGGTVTASVAALCNAVTGANTVVLRVADPQGLNATANLTVNVMANTPPTLSYNDQTVVLGGTLAINPATGPSDNGSVASITLQNVAPPTGPTATVNPTTGQVVLTNVNRTGRFNVIIQARDNCNANQTANFRVTVTGSAAALAARAVKNDFDGDGISDLVTWTAAEGKWQIRRSSDDVNQSELWGTPGDAPVPADYDGDGQTDLAVWRGSNGTWYIRKSADGQVLQQAWGASYAPYNDVPVPGDYDGDGKADIAVWRQASGTWYVRRSSDGGILAEQWGAPGDTVVPGDYDGDGKTDLAVWRGSDWHIKYSTGGVKVSSWGASYAPYFDVPVPADYDGDGKTDLAVWRGAESNWYIRRSSDGQTQAQRWGTSAAPYFDVPTPGDFDGDGKADIAIWRPADGTWYVIRSSNGTYLVRAHGQRGDQPVSGAQY